MNTVLNVVNIEPVIQSIVEHSHSNSLFCSKEHYLQFVASWKQYITDGRHIRSTYIDFNGGTCKNPSNLTSTHHLIYNTLRNRDLKKSFSPITNINKLQHTVYSNPTYGKPTPYHAFYRAVDTLKFVITYNRTDHVLEPFNGTVTEAMLKELYERLKDVTL